MPKATKNYIKNQYNYNCCQSSSRTQSSNNNWHYNKQSIYWVYFDHIRYKIQKAENQFKNTGSSDHWNKIKVLQNIQYQLVENAVNLQEEDVEDLIPLYTTVIKEEKPEQKNHFHIKEIITVKEEPESETETEISEESLIPNNQEELLEEELTDEEELLYKTYLKSQPHTPTSEY